MAESEKILVVDDDRSTRSLLRGVLIRQGYQIAEASNGAEALELFQQCNPALVLLDVLMPVMDGFTACAKIRHSDRDDTPVIILTADDDFSAIDRAFDVGATDFIFKPINWTLLIQRVRYALRAGALNREVRRNQMRQDSARRLSKLLFWEWQLNSDQLHWSDDLSILRDIVGHELHTVDEFFNVIHPEDQGRVQRTLQLTRQGANHIDIEMRLRVNGQIRVVRMVGERGKQLRDRDQVFGALQDLTDSRRAEALADYLALHDELTGLNNRRLFIRQIGEAITEIQHGDDDQHTRLFVAFIDLMRFHRHNDALGQNTGDLLLRRFAGRLGKLVSNPGAVARVGGDEFGILLRCTAQDNALDRFNALLANLSQPFYLDGNTDAFLTYTIGIAHYPDDGTDADELLAMAQEAQRLARNQGRGLAFAARDQQSGSRSSESLALERDLHRALDNEEFFLVYQPQMDLRQGRIVGVEALLRWQHPERGLVPPIQFIPILEDTGLIMRVGDWVIAEACRQSAYWSAQELALRVGINLSPRQFLEPTLFDRVMRLIAETGAKPNQIELEITESLAMQEPAAAIALLQRFRTANIQIAIDDFGIGHSSLEYLLKFPIDAIKIDRAFVINVTSALADRAIVRAVTAIGQTLGLNIIAEGVETLRQCDFLEALGVTEIQGYLIGKPMSPHNLIALLQTFSRPGF